MKSANKKTPRPIRCIRLSDKIWKLLLKIRGKKEWEDFVLDAYQIEK